MAVGDKENSYIISGTGDVLEPEGDVIGIGSGGNYALAAGKVLMGTEMNAEQLAKKAIEVAAEICVFTNKNVDTNRDKLGSFKNILKKYLNSEEYGKSYTFTKDDFNQFKLITIKNVSKEDSNIGYIAITQNANDIKIATDERKA